MDNNKFNNFINWCKKNNNIRTVILTSSRADINAQFDALSDYDIELYVNNINDFIKDDKWISNFGQILIKWPMTPRITIFKNFFTRLIQFEDGTRFDLQITKDKPKYHKNFDTGYKILIDKDNLTLNLNLPNYKFLNIKKPTKKQFDEKINDFYWNILYVAKNLWRDELFYVKYMLDNIIRFNILQVFIEWYIGLNNEWKVSTNKFGRYFKKYLSKEDWKKIEKTFVDSSISKNWNVIYKTIDLVNYLCSKIANDLGFNYPNKLENKIRKYINKIRKMK